MIAFAITLSVFTILGPFQSNAMPFDPRALFWAASLLGGWACVIGMQTLALRHPALDEWHGGARVTLAVLFARIPTTFLVSQIEALFGSPGQLDFCADRQGHFGVTLAKSWSTNPVSAALKTWARG